MKFTLEVLNKKYKLPNPWLWKEIGDRFGPIATNGKSIIYAWPEGTVEWVYSGKWEKNRPLMRMQGEYDLSHEGLFYSDLSNLNDENIRKVAFIVESACFDYRSPYVSPPRDGQKEKESDIAYERQKEFEDCQEREASEKRYQESWR